jgi:phosphoglycolate phosphatase-like HAD superfamily hydrolase
VTSRPEPTLVLWDVDHTLVNTAGLGRRMYEAAFLAVTGRTLRAVADMAGRTERAILTDTLALHDIAVGVEELDLYYAALSSAAHDLREAVASEGHALPGAVEALKMLAERGVVQTVVTGNLKPVAVVKLDAFGLAGYLDFEIGGYGSDGGERMPLIELARRRSTDSYGHAFRDDRIFVIGDTPHDIRAARAVGVRSIGVATGGSSAQALREARADAVLPDLRDGAALCELIFGTGLA